MLEPGSLASRIAGGTAIVAGVLGLSFAPACSLEDEDPVAPPASASPRVFVLGVDGASWNVIDEMAAEGQLPRLSELMDRGASARLRTVEPVSSPVVWTSLATGRSPDATGVTDFFATRLTVKVPSAYERLAADGVRVGLYDVLVTWPPADLPGGFVIPGWLRRDASVMPEDAWARTGLEPYVNDYDRMRTTRDYLEGSRLEVSLKPERFLALAKAFDTRVTATTIYSPDMTSHRFWHAAYPEDFDGEGADATAEAKNAIADAYRGVDAAVGTIGQALGPDDVLIVASDHGFFARKDGIRNVWVSHVLDDLATAGFDAERDGFSLLSAFGAVSLRVHPGPDDSPDTVRARDALVDRLVDHLRSYRTADGVPVFQTVEFLDGDGRPDSVPRPRTNRLRQWAVSRVLWLLFDVQSRDAYHSVVFGMPDDDVLAAGWPDGAIEVAGRPTTVAGSFSRQRFSGDHDPIGIFIAAGGPFAAVAERGELSVLDVAPLLFHLTGRGVPEDLEGRVPVELLRADALSARPVRSVSADTYPGLPSPAESGDDAPSAELMEKLRSLGYVE